MEAAPRISFVTPYAVQGGAESVLWSILRSMDPRSIAGVVVLQEGPFADDLRASGVRVDVVEAPKGLGLLSAALRLRMVLREQDASVVHANGLKAALLCVMAGPRRTGGPLWMKHDATGDPWLSRLVALGCSDVVGVSNAVMLPFAHRRRPSAVVHNGLPARSVDREAGRRAVRAALGPDVPRDAEVVALVGRICVGKGQAELVSALPGIVARGRDVHLLVVGPADPAFPEEREALERAAADAGVGDRLHLIGRRTDAVELVAGSDLLAAPSIRDPGGWREGFGLQVAEAMQVGTPVVAYASGSLPEVLGDAGVLVPEGDREALAEQIAALLGDEAARERLGTLGRARVASCFTAERFLDDMHSRYRALSRTSRAMPTPTRSPPVARTKAVRQLAHRIGLRSALMRGTSALGFDVVTRNFYSPVPDWRSEPPSRWEIPSPMRGVAFDVDAQLTYLRDELAPHFPEFTPPVRGGADPAAFHYDNGFFGPLDADVLYATVRQLRPRRIIELGSGHSTTVIAAAAARNAADGRPVAHDVYDPYAREELRSAIRAAAELHLTSATDVPIERFEELESGDVLFVDTTHTVKLASDVNFVILDVLPVLKPGVVVHIHDIFLPWEYPREWFEELEVYWAEQYLLQAYLSGNDRYEVLLGNAAVLRAHRSEVAALVPQLAHANNPGSFWLRAR